MENWEAHRLPTIDYNGKWVRNWFSNMVISPIKIDGYIYSSVENYYQSQKTLDVNDQIRISTASPSRAKYLGRGVTVRTDWKDIKESVMEKALKAKFSIPKWRDDLLATGDQVLVEWNNWNDKEWGASIVDNLGNNKLGKLLMRIRENLKEDEKRRTAKNLS